MNRAPLPAAEDDHDRKVLGDIHRVGWSVIGIEDDAESPPYCFSVGLYHTLGQPEVLIMGLRSQPAAGLINVLGDALREGQRFEPGRMYEGLASMPVAFVEVDPAQYRRYVGYAIWANRGPKFPLLQCVWPDRDGVFPWQPDYDARFFQAQRLLGPVGYLDHGWHFASPPSEAALTMSDVTREGRPILVVVRDQDDGTWQFLDGGPVSVERASLVALREIVRLDPSVAELATLPPGGRAWRSAPGHPWRRDLAPRLGTSGQAH